MKGAIFIAINTLVEDRFGIEAWEQLLDTVQPECGGIYTSTQDYPDSEVVDFVIAISNMLDMEVSEVTRTFGHFLFGELNSKYPMFSEQNPEFIPFVKSIESVIHKEVKKLYDNPSLPNIECQDGDGTSVVMRYSSPRKLCFLAEGLLYGAAEYFNETISITHDVCMHNGSDHCELVISIQ